MQFLLNYLIKQQLGIVAIRAVGIKQRNKIFIGGQEIEL